MRDEIVAAKLAIALEVVPERMHAAARAVLKDHDVFRTPEIELRRALAAAGLIEHRNGGSPGRPGVRVDLLPEGERPDNPETERQRYVRRLAAEMSSGGSPIQRGLGQISTKPGSPSGSGARVAEIARKLSNS